MIEAIKNGLKFLEEENATGYPNMQRREVIASLREVIKKLEASRDLSNTPTARQNLMNEVSFVLTDPDTDLSHGAYRSLKYVFSQLSKMPMLKGDV